VTRIRNEDISNPARNIAVFLVITTTDILTVVREDLAIEMLILEDTTVTTISIVHLSLNPIILEE
jgi:hypothetical protein